MIQANSISQQTNYVINYRAVNFRSGPGLYQHKIGLLTPKDTVCLLEKTKVGFRYSDGVYYHWIKVKQLSSQTIGYVYGKYLTKISAEFEDSQIENFVVNNIPTYLSILYEQDEFDDIDNRDEIENLSSYKPKTYVISIGISKYEESESSPKNLQYAHRDAIDFAKIFSRDSSNSKSIILTDEDATSENLKGAITAQLKHANPLDIFILNFSGHGNKNSLCMIDRSINILTELFPLLKEENRAVKKLLFLDSCHSGKEVNQSNDFDTAVQEFADNISIFSSSGFEDYSYESTLFRNGVFTEYLLLGLRGSADKNRNSIIEYGELVSYTTRRVHSYTSKNYEFPQVPQTSGNDLSNLPLVQSTGIL